MGVVGVDLLAATVERLLGADLDATEGVHVVVNRVGRVVASTDLEHVVGDLVHGLPDTPWFTGRRRTGDGDGSALAVRHLRRPPPGRPDRDARRPRGDHRLTRTPRSQEHFAESGPYSTLTRREPPEPAKCS